MDEYKAEVVMSRAAEVRTARARAKVESGDEFDEEFL